VLESTPNCPAAQVGARQVLGSVRDPEAIAQLAHQTDVMTWEIEHIDADTLAELEKSGHNIQPSPVTLQVLQDKYLQKEMLKRAGLPVRSYAALPSGLTDRSERSQAMVAITERFGCPLIVKSRTGGYDGRGNYVYRGDLDAMDERLGADWDDLYAEEMVVFDKELSVVAARDQSGKIATYPIIETQQKDSICHVAMAPANISPRLARDAQEVAHETMKVLGGAGVFAVEMFAVGDVVAINEIAPRVHNSGHHTIEANHTSQFEQHIRAVTGMPLGSTALRAPAAVMINVLGTREEPLRRDGLRELLALPDTHVHFYGKSSRPARKIGHITVLGQSLDQILPIAERARGVLTV
jgi:phosphoribosylaminoimidazole carboxylase PurK protein